MPSPNITGREVGRFAPQPFHAEVDAAQRQADEGVNEYWGRLQFAALSADLADEYIADAESLWATCEASSEADKVALFNRLADDQQDAGLGVASILRHCRRQARRAA